MKLHPYADAPRLPEAETIDPRSLLPGSGFGELEVEIGPGRGGFMFERLAARPDVGMIGLEIRLKWATIVDRRLREKGYGGRARVFAADARLALPRFVPNSVAVIHVHFPDPWWKKRHHKRLVVGERLIEAAARVLREGGELFLQTDVAERADAYEALVGRDPRFLPYASNVRVDESPYSARSSRERRALADGLPIFRLHWRRV
jgi:tRNA (guanine-N7-)-methyltransferase